MPIYPRTAASPGVSTASSPNAPKDPSGQQLYELGKQAEQTTAVLTDIKHKRDEFKDETNANERYMTAMLDLETVNEDLQNPANAEDAKAFFAKEYADRRPKWYEGLSPRAQMKLEQKLFPRELEYRVNAGRIENRALGDKHEAVGVGMKNLFIDSFARSAVTSFNADGSVVAGADVDGTLTREFMEYTAYLEDGKRLGYRKPQAVEQEKEAAIATAAFYRANKLVGSESEADLRQYTKLYRAESASPGSTFLRNIDAGKRDDMNTKASTRVVELREKAEVVATRELKRQESAFVGRVVRYFSMSPDDQAKMKPEERLSNDQIEAGLNQFSTIMPRETVDAITKLQTQKYREGGITNWNTYHDLKIRILSQDAPLTEHNILRNVPVSLSAKHAEELLKLNEATSAESAVEKTRFFKEGKEHIRTLIGGTMLPGMEWLMKTVDRQRYSDALFNFSKHARKVYAEGDQAQIAALPEYARKLATTMKMAGNEGTGAKQLGDTPQTQQKQDRPSPKPAFSR